MKQNLINIILSTQLGISVNNTTLSETNVATPEAKDDMCTETIVEAAAGTLSPVEESHVDELDDVAVEDLVLLYPEDGELSNFSF